MLKIVSISKQFNSILALDCISITFSKNEIVGLIGPNGSGKTTLLNIASGLLKPDLGKVIIENHELSSLAPHRIAKLGIARNFQNLRIFKRMTVLENVLAAKIGNYDSRFFNLFFYASQVNRLELENAESALESAGIIDAKDRLAKTLPFPDLRRLEVARILVRDPKVVFLDEPAGGMTPFETEAMGNLIMEKVAVGRLCILIEHKIDLIKNICERICVLNSGRLIADGSPLNVLESREVKEAYIGMGTYDA